MHIAPSTWRISWLWARATPDAGDDPETTRALGTITATGVRPISLPTQISTIMEGITGAQTEASIHAVDA